jgi:hypothetical protein
VLEVNSERVARFCTGAYGCFRLFSYTCTKYFPLQILHRTKGREGHIDRTEFILEAPEGFWRILNIVQLIQQKSRALQGWNNDSSHFLKASFGEFPPHQAG